MKFSIFGVFLAALLSCSQAFATDVARLPLGIQGSVQPNVIFGMDDSGSMDFEVLLNTSDGAFWWNNSTRTGWDNTGKPLFNLAGATSSTWWKLTYLFPNGCSDSTRKLCDASGHYAIPPTPQFASLRSSDHNPAYYDPAITYASWPAATIGATPRTFGNVTATSAPSHPLFTTTQDLTVEIDRNDSNWVFLGLRGMTIPRGASIYTNKWTELKSDVVIGQGSYSGNSYTVSIPYYPASYWVKENCSRNSTTCVDAPDSGTLKLYEIKSGRTFPSGRTYAQELQNFANWYTYSRKRRLALAGSMGTVIESLSGMRVGLVGFNSLSPVTMYNTDSLDARANGRVVAGRFYSNDAEGGTPTRETLKYIGEQYRTNKNIIEASCQRNTAFIVTDGFANASSVTSPSYSASTYGAGAPYSTTYVRTLADIALSYYTNQLRTDLPAGRVPAAAVEASNPAADRNNNLHMNTYGITLGAEGFLWPNISDPYAQAPTWVNPTVDRSPHSIDDLWHATVNGRGGMLLSTTPQQTAQKVQSALTEILRLSGAQGSVTFSTVNLRASNSTAYVGSYNLQGWSGDIAAYPVNPQTGALSTTRTWSASEQLGVNGWSSRRILTFKNGVGTTFTNANIGANISTGGLATSADAVDYLRGKRNLEATTLRTRTGALGAVINAEPVVDGEAGIVYATSGEGMLHAFDMATGKELWAYVPGFTLPDQGKQLDKTWRFETLLDASPVLAKVGSRKMLVGGRGTAGPGVYAIDVTDPVGTLTEANLAARVKWEFPAANASAALKASVGATVGKPLVINTAAGPRVVVTSGYNSTQDGKGRVFVLNALTGELLQTLVTTAGSLGSGDAGLAQVSGFLEAGGNVRYAYGGDELGNVWRFDLDTGAVLRLATLKDANGAALPVTSAPELARIGNRRMVYISTGRFLGDSDFDDPQRHSFFGLWDNNTTISGRNVLATRTVTVLPSGVRRATGTAINWSTQRGFVVDLPMGEKANTDPSMASGVVAFTTNSPSKVACSASSALYIMDAGSGLELPAASFVGEAAYFGIDLGATLTTRTVLTRLSNNRLGVTTRQSDGTDATRSLNVSALPAPQKTSWREVLQ